MWWLFLAHCMDVDNSDSFLNAGACEFMWKTIKKYIEMAFGISTIKSYFAILWIIAIVRIVANVRCSSISVALAKCAEFQVNRNCHLFFPVCVIEMLIAHRQAANVHRKCEAARKQSRHRQKEREWNWKERKSPCSYMLYANAYVLFTLDAIKVYL